MVDVDVDVDDVDVEVFFNNSVNFKTSGKLWSKATRRSKMFTVIYMLHESMQVSEMFSTEEDLNRFIEELLIEDGVGEFVILKDGKIYPAA